MSQATIHSLFANVLLGVFHLIEFTESKTASVISSVWVVNDNRCCYPTKWAPGKVAQSARRYVKPHNDWEVFDI
jgi:hypothetical protein